ncbi:unnamed protein product [Anisakis simplex]|uniref:SH3 domain-containing protein n=1 Tax=Anisakis simplex TaxID=6269 RepID=A0A0M3JHT8_ANISI|nr:unnamed protein product [Anisakis simplex]
MMTSSENNTSNAEHEIRNDDKTKQICRVLYDFNANADDEITIKAGDCVIIEGRINDDWLYGYTISDKSKTGRFPTTYVTQ